MITLTSEAKGKLEAALARAQAEKITLRESVDGAYFVNGKHDTYLVLIAKVDGQLVTECNCTAGQHGRVCKHAALALANHKAKLEERAAVKAYEALEPTPAPEPTCYCSECGTEHLASLNICPGCGFNYITRQMPDVAAAARDLFGW